MILCCGCCCCFNVFKCTISCKLTTFLNFWLSHFRVFPKFPLPKNKKRTIKNLIFSCSCCSCTMFIVSSYSVHTGHVQYLQNAVFSFEKGSNGQNPSLSDSQHLITPPYPLLSPTKFPIPPKFEYTIWKIQIFVISKFQICYLLGKRRRTQNVQDCLHPVSRRDWKN